MKFEKTVVILTPNRNLEFFLAEFVPYFVSALDHIYPLCSAVSASSGANSAQKSFSTFLSGISIMAKDSQPDPKGVRKDKAKGQTPLTRENQNQNRNAKK